MISTNISTDEIFIKFPKVSFKLSKNLGVIFGSTIIVKYNWINWLHESLSNSSFSIFSFIFLFNNKIIDNFKSLLISFEFIFINSINFEVNVTIFKSFNIDNFCSDCTRIFLSEEL